MSDSDPVRDFLARLWRFTDGFVPEAVLRAGGIPLLRTRLLVFFCWLFVGTALLALIPRAMQPEAARTEILAFLTFTAFAAVAPWLIRLTGRSEPVSVFILGTGILAAVVGAGAMEGLFSASVMWLSTLPFITAFLIAPSSTFWAIGVSTAIYVAFAWAHHVGGLEPHPLPMLLHRCVNLTALTVFSAVIARLHQWSADEARAAERGAQQLVQVVSRRMGVGTVLIAGGEVILANAAAHALLGVGGAGLVGRRWSDVLPGGVPEGAAAREIDVRVGECTLRVELHAGPLDEGTDGGALLVTASDITRRWEDEQARRRDQAEVESALREKETLLKEIHHRVKNNLQIISSLLSLQTERMPDEQARALLDESVNRVRSMSLIHEQLYAEPSLSSIEFAAYTRRLVGSVGATLAPEARIEVHAEPVELTVDQALPLGLVLNEFLTNAVKYGTRGPRRDTPPPWDVEVRLAREGTEVVLSVRDHGPGFPPDFRLEGARSLGLRIATGLVRQIRGALRIVPGDGGHIEVRLPA